MMEYALTGGTLSQTLGVVGDTTVLDFLNVEYHKNMQCDVLFVTECENPNLVRSFVSEGGVAWLHGLDPEQITALIDVECEPMQYEKLPVLLVEHELTRGLSNQEFYWTGERQQWWVPLSTDIADYFLSAKSGEPLTAPCVLLKVPYEKGFFIIDMLHYEKDTVKSARIVSTILTNLGISIKTPNLVIQAETMTVEEVYLGERGDITYAFYTNGYLGTPVDFVMSGVYTFQVFAWADMNGGEGAMMEIFIDRISIETIEITTKGMYEVTLCVEKGIHQVGIAFTNDFYDPPDDRNLYVDKIAIVYQESSCTVC
jgi:hypothetical protein